jgi:hypothetical protein
VKRSIGEALRRAAMSFYVPEMMGHLPQAMSTPRGSSRLFGSIIDPNMPTHPALAKPTTSNNMVKI